MAVLGGICFLIIGQLNEVYQWEMALISQMSITSLVITLLELTTGLIVNQWVTMGVWDYSQTP